MNKQRNEQPPVVRRIRERLSREVDIRGVECRTAQHERTEFGLEEPETLVRVTTVPIERMRVFEKPVVLEKYMNSELSRLSAIDGSVIQKDFRGQSRPGGSPVFHIRVIKYGTIDG